MRETLIAVSVVKSLDNNCLLPRMSSCKHDHYFSRFCIESEINKFSDREEQTHVAP